MACVRGMRYVRRSRLAARGSRLAARGVLQRCSACSSRMPALGCLLALGDLGFGGEAQAEWVRQQLGAGAAKLAAAFNTSNHTHPTLQPREAAAAAAVADMARCEAGGGSVSVSDGFVRRSVANWLSHILEVRRLQAS